MSESYPRPLIVRQPPYCEQDHPPPSAAEMKRRLARDRALQHWHASARAQHPIVEPFEAWWLHSRGEQH
jgi:hypothetical protein